ncbi:MAG TPA: hypothetical protein VF221_23320 [Chloroflexota bacterium]
MSTAVVTLQTEFDLTPTGGAAICFRPVSSGQFAELQREIDQLLTVSTKDSPLQWSSKADAYGYQWIILRAEEFSNLVATIHMISRELEDAGFGEQLLAAAFQFRTSDGRNVYWLYNYKRGTFYPFVPSLNQTRDNAMELRLSSVLKGELNIEQDLTKWYALWGIPLDR